MFEQSVLDPTTYKYDASKQMLTVSITSALTAKAGHKHLLLTDSVLGSNGSPSQTLLSFDVTRR
ncbi:MAG TPA: hypothetical protein VK578_03280 [Edaphobacter sp.]|nr:hypothetical protein [Edaphobacter sp.]